MHVNKSTQLALRAALVYCVIAGIWILFSDRILAGIVTDPVWLTRLQTCKGLAFVAVTAVFFGVILRNRRRAGEREAAERLETEHKLREALAEAQRFREALDRVPAYVFMKDTQFRYLYGNRLTLELFRCSAGELAGRDDTQFFPPETVKRLREIDSRVFQGVQTIEEVEVPDPAGGRRVYWEVKTPIYADAERKKLWGLLGISTDITERKKAEESHARLATAVEQAAETIIITDPAGKILYVNPAFQKTTGYNCAEAIGQNPRLLKSAKHDDGFYRRMWNTLRQGEVWSGHFVNRRKDGTLYEAEASISPIRDASGAVVNYVAVEWDATREMQLEAQIRQAQKMEVVGRLAGGVAHDFNNILAVIKMVVELMKTDGKAAPELLSYANDIGVAVDRAAALTRQLLLFGRKEILLPRNLDLNNSVNHMAKMLQRVLGEDIQLQFRFSPEPLVVRVDPGMLDQVLMNLAVNSRDAMPNGGKLVIETAAAEFDPETAAQTPQARAGSFVCLSVADTGDGIAPEDLPRIFEPFFTTKDVGKGTGLGLAIVYGIVQQHQGWINVSSEPGRGAVFRIYLPRLVETNAPEPELSLQSSAAGGGETILLVEDDVLVCAAMRKALSKLGYRLLVAANAVEALELWKQHRAEIQLLLTDLVMPGGINGRELAGQLLKDNPGLKVIYASGYSADVVGKDLPLQEGVNYVSKPFQIRELAQTIRFQLDT